MYSRGNYPTLSTGFSFGCGPKKPYNICNNTGKQQRALDRLVSHQSFVRYSGMCNAGVSIRAPRLYRHCGQFLQEIQEVDPTLCKAFDNSVFPATTFNFGPQANVPYGWCAVTALGDYDHMRRGHLVLWDLKLVIKFPPGSMILIPSAILTHSNTPVQKGRPDSPLPSGAQALCSVGKVFREQAASRWEEVLGYFSTLFELKSDLEASSKAN
ncbi:hypothetical protein FA95DRAFT_1612697 [Auriscalpium vulgare]|uniref:Uncharacterized protein n=1 Tax=Auriscalpium vulgare TaxID=40419 RepID=A0ACB8R6U7_9AGAM|nr:hypothetical protein FA95DRAFT_1612697 [Auriscalpium vulgare]